MGVFNKIGRTNMVNIAMFIIAIVVVSFFFPSERKFSYKYEQGTPWNYSLLTAPFDMPINMDSVTAKLTKDSIDANFAPIYERDAEVEHVNLKKLDETLGKDASVTPLMKAAIIERVKEVYARGIVDSNTKNALASGKMPGIRCVVNNVLTPIPTEKVMTVKESYVYLDSVFAGANYKGVLSRNHVNDNLIPNLIHDKESSEKMLEQVYQKSLAPIGVVLKGERIIDRGEKITPQLYTVLKTFERMSKERSSAIKGDHYPIVGQVLLVTIMLFVFFVFMYYYRPRTYKSFREMLFLVLFITVFTSVALVVKEMSPNALYYIPFAMVPIVLSTFMDSRIGFMANVIIVLICALTVPSPLEFIVLQVVVSIVAIVSVRSLVRRSQLVYCAIYVFLAYCLVYIGMVILTEGSILKFNKAYIVAFAINSVVLSFNFVLVFVLEKLFGFITTVTLIELSDVNTPLLRELSEKCPGTFQHSMQVANLAAEVAHRLDANVHLVRAGALYHDIGKMGNPAFFTENQRSVNPHDSLPPEQSARIVIKHVTDGLARAEKENLPAVIRDFIVQHHGLGVAKYFYMRACANDGAENVDKSIYSYPGPNPLTREATIVMMADATEAAAKSLKEHTDEAITALVNNIINSQMAEGLYKDSPMRLREIEIAKKTFIERLCTIYHTRVSYNIPSSNDKK